MKRFIYITSTIIFLLLILFFYVKHENMSTKYSSINQSKQKTAATTLEGNPAIPQFSHVFLIVMENQNWDDIQSNQDASYINKILLPMSSYATNYHNPPENHPSLPNYLWLEAGTNFGIHNDDTPYTNHQNTSKHLVTLLNEKGISWKSYQESISGKDCPLSVNYPYSPKHNPMLYFDDVTDNNNPSSSYCISHIRPYTEIYNDLRYNTVSQYNFITPNLCNDMHDSCVPINNNIKQGDIWLSKEIPKILSSSSFKKGGVIFITWDESESSFADKSIGLIVLSSYAKGNGYSNNIYYTHSSLLKTIEESFQLNEYLGNSKTSNDLSDLFKKS